MGGGFVPGVTQCDWGKEVVYLLIVSMTYQCSWSVRSHFVRVLHVESGKGHKIDIRGRSHRTSAVGSGGGYWKPDRFGRWGAQMNALKYETILVKRSVFFNFRTPTGVRNRTHVDRGGGVKNRKIGRCPL